MKHYARLCIILFALSLATPLAHADVNLSCTIWTDKSTYAPGDSARISWLSINARSATLDGVGPVALSGFRTATAAQSGTLTLRVKDSSGRETRCQTSYTVRTMQPSCAITAAPLSVAKDSFVTITWSTRHATAATISGLGSVPLSGSRIIRADRSNLYTLVGTGAGGSCTQSANVNVRNPASAYGYFPTVASNIVAPLFGVTPTRNASSPYTYDSYYFDTYYVPTYDANWYEEVYYEPAWYEEDYAPAWEDEKFIDTAKQDDCWWDYWCGDGLDKDPGELSPLEEQGWLEGGERFDKEQTLENLDPCLDDWCREYGPESGVGRSIYDIPDPSLEYGPYQNPEEPLKYDFINGDPVDDDQEDWLPQSFYNVESYEI